jgi:hypothetical protein
MNYSQVSCSSSIHLKSSQKVWGGNEICAYIFDSLKRKKWTSLTPLNLELNALILALKDSAEAFLFLFSKKFRINFADRWSQSDVGNNSIMLS